VALPRRKQTLAKFIPFHDLTRETVAKALGTNRARVNNICKGITFPSPDEIAALERLFGVPIEVLLDPAMLEYRDPAKWPPLRGFQQMQVEYRRLRAEAGK